VDSRILTDSSCTCSEYTEFIAEPAAKAQTDGRHVMQHLHSNVSGPPPNQPFQSCLKTSRMVAPSSVNGRVERLGGVGEIVAGQLRELTGKEARTVVLGHLVRGDHNSKAVHRAYARKAKVELPSLGEYERQRKMFAEGKVAEPVAKIVNV
jgi:hypothetical protein